MGSLFFRAAVPYKHLVLYGTGIEPPLKEKSINMLFLCFCREQSRPFPAGDIWNYGFQKARRHKNFGETPGIDSLTKPPL